MALWPWIGHELPRPLLPALHNEDVAQSAFLKLCFTAHACPGTHNGYSFKRSTAERVREDAVTRLSKFLYQRTCWSPLLCGSLVTPEADAVCTAGSLTPSLGRHSAGCNVPCLGADVIDQGKEFWSA